MTRFQARVVTQRQTSISKKIHGIDALIQKLQNEINVLTRLRNSETRKLAAERRLQVSPSTRRQVQSGFFGQN